jgi:hypothetical protein
MTIANKPTLLRQQVPCRETLVHRELFGRLEHCTAFAKLTIGHNRTINYEARPIDAHDARTQLCLME